MKPKMMKRSPAILLRKNGATYCDNIPPIIVAIADVRISANEDPIKTLHFDDSPEENARVASCVLSPSSAMNIIMKTEPITLMSSIENLSD
jgi:hypothetical protein